MRANSRVGFHASFQASGRTSIDTLGRLRYSRTGSLGGERKHTTFFQPRAANWTEISRAKASPPPTRNGLTARTETTVLVRGKGQVSMKSQRIRSHARP